MAFELFSEFSFMYERLCRKIFYLLFFSNNIFLSNMIQSI
jgi:hypothetical protein